MTEEEVADRQRAVCARFGVVLTPSPSELKCGLAGNVKGSRLPLHGLRHPPEGDTIGWYFWMGDLSDDPGFFHALHVSHLAAQVPEVMPFLGLPPGWRALLAPGREDIWFDEALLSV